VLGGLRDVLHNGSLVNTTEGKRAIVIMKDNEGTSVHIILEGTQVSKEADIATLTPVDNVCLQ